MNSCPAVKHQAQNEDCIRSNVRLWIYKRINGGSCWKNHCFCRTNRWSICRSAICRKRYYGIHSFFDCCDGYKYYSYNCVLLNTKTTTAFKIIEYSYTYSLAVGGAITISASDFGVSTPSGYTPLCMARVTSGHNAVCIRAFYGDIASGAALILRHVGNLDIDSSTATIRIVYVKTSFI